MPVKRTSHLASDIGVRVLGTAGTTYLARLAPERLVVTPPAYGFDASAAVAVLDIAYGFAWCRHDEPRTGCAVAVAVLNLTTSFMNLSLGSNSKVLVVDDAGTQYGALDDCNLYWLDGDDDIPATSFVAHGDILVPEARIEGLFLFPPLRRNATRYRRMFIAGAWQVDDEWIDVSIRIDIGDH